MDTLEHPGIIYRGPSHDRRAALEFAARHPREIDHRIARNERAIAQSREATEQRRALLA